MTYTVKSLCGLLGISRQGYYKHKDKVDEVDILTGSIVMYCLYIRGKDNLPKAGCRQLYELCRQYFKEKFVIGRDQFYSILRANGLMLRQRKFHPRTTDSRHRFKIYSDLVNTSPRFVPEGNGRLIVCDITYICIEGGFAYLSLITDAYSRSVVGYCLSRTLDREGPLTALKNAISLYHRLGIDISSLIHHSDRGVQYASTDYVNLLKSNNIRISMTQTGDPLHNALAERMNNTLKNEWLFNNGNMTFEEAGKAIDKAVIMYNTARPHSALSMRTPQEILTGSCLNPLIKPAWR